MSGYQFNVKLLLNTSVVLMNKVSALKSKAKKKKKAERAERQMLAGGMLAFKLNICLLKSLLKV